MSSEHDGSPPDEVEVDLSDLRGGAPERVDGNERSVRQRLLWRSVVLSALALVVAALIYSARYAVPATPPAQATPTGVATFLPPTGLGCVRDAAWDPSSALIALVGPPDTACGYDIYSPNVVNIYRARTGALVRQLHPDPALFAALGLPQPAPMTPTPSATPRFPTLMYQTLLWSPDGAQLAISFDAFIGPDPSQIITGMVLLDANGRHERVLVDHQGGPPAAYTVWDLQAGTSIPVGTAPAGPPHTPTLPPALSYTWGRDGSLIPDAPLAGGAEPPPPALDLVGNPDGGHSFGLWQPGQILAVALPTSGQQAPTYLSLFGASFTAWSPDGRYITDQLSVGGLLLSSGQPLPAPSVLHSAQLDQVVALPLRDAALQQALAHDVSLPAGLAPYAATTLALVAWRPDGNVLAILNQHNGYILRASATGRIVKSVPVIEVPPESLGPPGAFGTLYRPLWSPDGTWLLLPTLGLVRVGQLSL
jgi:hypothetical protein